MIQSFSPIRLEDMDRVRLMNRVDSKFVFHDSVLRDLLFDVRNDYSVLEIESKRIFEYDSLYLDTEDYAMYKQHHNGKPKRIKLRYRTYKETGDVFFEVKQRKNPLRTDKHRVKVGDIPAAMGEQEVELLAHLAAQFDVPLEQKLRVAYKRITLVANDGIERVTIDVSLEFDDFTHTLLHPHLVIAEIKQERFSRTSPFIQALRTRNIKEHSISKYALGLVELNKNLKSNAFRSKVKIVEQIEERQNNG